MLGKVGRAMVTRPFYVRDVIEQFDAVGVGSLTVVLLTGMFTGMVLALVSAITLDQLGALHGRPAGQRVDGEGAGAGPDRTDGGRARRVRHCRRARLDEGDRADRRVAGARNRPHTKTGAPAGPPRARSELGSPRSRARRAPCPWSKAGGRRREWERPRPARTRSGDTGAGAPDGERFPVAGALAHEAFAQRERVRDSGGLAEPEGGDPPQEDALRDELVESSDAASEEGQEPGEKALSELAGRGRALQVGREPDRMRLDPALSLHLRGPLLEHVHGAGQTADLVPRADEGERPGRNGRKQCPSPRPRAPGRASRCGGA